MTSNLATKQDLQLVKQEVVHLEQLMTTRFDAFDSRFSLMLQNLETRIVVKLGTLMTVLFGAAAAALAVFR